MTRLKVALIVAACTLGIGGFAAAQQPSQRSAMPAPSAKSATLDDQIEQEARNLSSAQKIKAASDRIDKMKGTLSQTEALLAKVRQSEQDILKLNCINEKLAAIKGFLKVSEQSMANLKQASDRKDEEAEVHHYTLIAIAGQKVEDLGQEARTCVGQAQMFAGATAVKRHEAPGIAPVNPITIDDDSFDDAFATETLPELTPFQ